MHELKVSVITAVASLLLFSCASGINGSLGGERLANTTSRTERWEIERNITEFLNNIKPGETSLSNIEVELGLPTDIIKLNEERTFWIYEVCRGKWFLFFGSASLKQHVFEIKNEKVVKYYVKKSAQKSGIFTPTVVVDPSL